MTTKGSCDRSVACRSDDAALFLEEFIYANWTSVRIEPNKSQRILLG